MALTSQDLIFGYRFNELNFAVPGPVFPGNTGGTNSLKMFSSEPQVMTINWGDEVFDQYTFPSGGGLFFIEDNRHVFPKIVTLLGTSGSGNISFGTNDFLVTFDTDLTTTASNFVTNHQAALDAIDIKVTANAGVLTFVFTGINQNLPIFTNLTGDLGATIEDTQSSYNISFTFEKPDAITSFDTLNVDLGDSFPNTVTKLISLEEIVISNSFGNFGLTTFPSDLSSLRSLIELVVTRAQLPKIDASILALSNLQTLIFTNSLDLNDSAGNFEATNFDRLNELQNSLKTLSIQGCNVNTLPSSFIELTLLESLLIGDNTYTTLPVSIPSEIKILDLGRNNFLTNWTNFDRLTNITKLTVGENSEIITNIPISSELSQCKKLKNINQFGFQGAQIDRRNSYILNLYSFVTTYANLNPFDTSIDQNKFRDMVVLLSGNTPAFTGTYQAPPDFVQGSNNGNPSTPEEYVYVLVQNYGHTWTVAGTTYQQI